MPGGEATQEITVKELAVSAAPSKVLKQVDGQDLALVQLASGGDTFLPDGSPVYWRGVMEINGYHAGLAVYGPNDSKVSGDYGRKLLQGLASQMKSRSPASSD